MRHPRRLCDAVDEIISVVILPVRPSDHCLPLSEGIRDAIASGMAAWLMTSLFTYPRPSKAWPVRTH